MRPIVGLVHHGSGPRHTSVLDPGFAEGLAQYARAVAERYPWIDGYTPVNEPLTTARFSCLYGHWYPHRRSMRDCVRALLVQCRAVVLSMRAIRSVNPAAYLVQNEDLGKTYSTPLLAYQSEFNNHFRWLTFDLLCGMVGRAHPLWDFLIHTGATPDELDWFGEHSCPPDILGIDCYLSGERFLDERLGRYPGEESGGNGRHRYVDVMATRVLPGGTPGPKGLIAEAWERYHRPMALTEVHNGCTREEQMRWFVEVWDAASDLRAEGVDIRAVTAWAVFGLHGWNALCTSPGGDYEVGVYDSRHGQPRPTAMAPVLRALAAGERPRHPLLAIPGWWKRDVRLARGAGNLVGPGSVVTESVYRTVPLLVLGETGLEARLAPLCHQRGIPYQLVRPDRLASPAHAGDLVLTSGAWAAVVGDCGSAPALIAACRLANVPVAYLAGDTDPIDSPDALGEILDRLVDGESWGLESGETDEATLAERERLSAGC